MPPHAAPPHALAQYRTVKEVYKLEGLTSRDKDIIKKYEREFTVNMPGRGFNERINSRQST